MFSSSGSESDANEDVANNMVVMVLVGLYFVQMPLRTPPSAKETAPED